jgi:branched-chain amino acid aminotransferase
MASESKKPKFVLFNGDFVPFEEAKIHVLSPCARYGINVFEALRGYWNEKQKQLYAFRVREHCERLAESMRLMALELPEPATSHVRLILETLRKNEIREDCRIFHTVYVDGFGNSAATAPVGYFITPMPVGRLRDIEKGVTATISPWIRNSDNSMPPRIKTGANYVNGRLGAIWANRSGYDEPIFTNVHGKVSEGATSCFFMVRKKVLISPPFTADVLESITRDTLIRLAREELMLPVEIRDIDRTEVYLAEEAFICGSAAEITPIISVDKFTLGEGKPGPITKKLQEAYFHVTRGDNPKYLEWANPVY